MKLLQSTLERNFTVKHYGKTYYLNYLNADGPILLNRYHWEILDKELEELNIYEFKSMTKKEKEQVKKNMELANKLIEFCIKHFNDFQPNYKEN